MIDLYLKIHDHKLFDNLLDFINNFGDSDQSITASAVRSDDTKWWFDTYWYMTVFFDGDEKEDYYDTSYVSDVFTDIMSQFDWNKYV